MLPAGGACCSISAVQEWPANLGNLCQRRSSKASAFLLASFDKVRLRCCGISTSLSEQCRKSALNGRLREFGGTLAVWCCTGPSPRPPSHLLNTVSRQQTIVWSFKYKSAGGWFLGCHQRRCSLAIICAETQMHQSYCLFITLKAIKLWGRLKIKCYVRRQNWWFESASVLSAAEMRFGFLEPFRLGRCLSSLEEPPLISDLCLYVSSGGSRWRTELPNSSLTSRDPVQLKHLIISDTKKSHRQKNPTGQVALLWFKDARVEDSWEIKFFKKTVILRQSNTCKRCVIVWFSPKGRAGHKE